MQLTPVQSGRIKALGYDEGTWTCYVQFHPTAREPKGPVYAYANVPPELYERFMAAPSLGRFFGQQFTDRAAHPSLYLGEPHAVKHRTALPAGTGALTAQGGRRGKVQPIAVSQKRLRADEELSQLMGERQKLIDFFRPMKEATLAAHRAVIAQEQEALAEFANAEATIASGLEHSREA
ncbi:MAG: KTSC domain-containing protein [Janthinobacterium lividum]